MRTWVKAFVAGVLIEAVLFTAMNTAESGPCGPSTQWGGFLILLHMPSAVLLMPVAWMVPDEGWFASLWFVAAAVLWSLLAYGLGTLWKRVWP